MRRDFNCFMLYRHGYSDDLAPMQVKRDLRLLRLRGAMDPKRFYKSFDQSKFPKYFQFGTVVEGPADFYSGAPPHASPCMVESRSA